MIPNLNDGTDTPPRWARFLSAAGITELPEWSAGPRGKLIDQLHAVKAAGYEGMQLEDAAACHAAGLLCAGGGRINEPTDADDLARRCKDAGQIAATCHMGWGVEDDDQVDRLVDAVFNAVAKHNLPIYIETHRATCTQDIWRTVKLCQRQPGIRLNGDFSHWYTGLEMPYGTVEMKCDFARPAFDRVRFMHGRIGNSGCMQKDVGDSLEDALSRDYVQHFVHMWTLCIQGFLQDAKPGDILCFAPELIRGANYAIFQPDADGKLREETDRWQQSLLYMDLFEHAWQQAAPE